MTVKKCGLRTMRWLTVAGVLLVTTACSGGSSDPSESGIGGSMPALGTLRVTIDGATRDLSANATKDITTDSVIVSGDDAALNTVFAFQTAAKVGTRAIPDIEVIGVYAPDGDIDVAYWAAYDTVGSGSIVIKSITTTSITGTFTFSLQPFGTAAGTKTVTGSFNSPLFSN